MNKEKQSETDSDTEDKLVVARGRWVEGQVKG